MLHLYKICLQRADLFISELDLEKKFIAYTVRDKMTGNTLEPHFKSNLLIEDKQVTFDSRYIDLNFAKHIEAILKS